MFKILYKVCIQIVCVNVAIVYKQIVHNSSFNRLFH